MNRVISTNELRVSSIRNLSTRPKNLLIAAFVAVVAFAGAVSTDALAQRRVDFDQARHELVEGVLRDSGITDTRVLRSMNDVPRHEFVARTYRNRAYFDMSLPIGAKQTISSPFIVAYMTESLETKQSDKVLEIGTGSGYQAAILSGLVADVYTIEIVPELGRRAGSVLKRLKYKNVHAKIGDGYKGWPEHAPFDKIIVTCSPENVPQPLIEQLAEGGRMIVPVGERYQQVLYLFKKRDGKLASEALRPTLFVPMTGRAEDGRQVKPDPLDPKVVNSSFEKPASEKGDLSGWYYQRQLRLETDATAPDGEHFVTFHNEELGRGSHAMQGFAVDGSKVTRMQISCSVKADDISRPVAGQGIPMMSIAFYDDSRREIGQHWLGPWQGTFEWRRESKVIRVPARAREGILRIGLFGSTGEVSFDEVRIRVPRKP